MNKNMRATKEFGLTVAQARVVESLVATVPAEVASVLRFALVVGIGEMNPDKPFQTVASNILREHSEGVK